MSTTTTKPYSAAHNSERAYRRIKQALEYLLGEKELMSKRNKEITSATVSKKAGKVLANLSGFNSDLPVISARYPFKQICTVGDLKAIAASALTQTKDK